eukprot:jgi/Galph1/4045/GphlegSOOS_G2646.1
MSSGGFIVPFSFHTSIPLVASLQQNGFSLLDKRKNNGVFPKRPRLSTLQGRSCRHVLLTTVRCCQDDAVSTGNVYQDDSRQWQLNKEQTTTENKEQNNSTVSKRQLSLWRLRIFSGIFISYTAYTICRSTFTFVAPLLLQSGALQLQQVGLVTSSFPIFYGFSKLFGGILVDHVSSRKILGGGLSLSGLTNVGLGLSFGYQWYATWWGANGIAQGCGAGACARMLTAWFKSSERGFWWALWSCSANIGGVLAPIISGILTRRMSWRAAMIVPGMFSIMIGILSAWLIRDTPQEAGLYRNNENAFRKQHKSLKEDRKSHHQHSSLSLPTFVKQVLQNKKLWLLALSYFFVYFVKTGIRSFYHIYLMEQKGCFAADAAYRVSGMDLGGLAGTFMSGVLSDRLEGYRVPVVVLFLTGLIVSLVLAILLRTTGMNNVWIDFVTVALFGCCLSGPTCLIGLIGAELSDRRTVATATGLLGNISYLGAAFAGLPVTLAIRRFGWNAYFLSLMFSSFSSLLILLPLWNAKAKQAMPSDDDEENIDKL